MIHFARRTAALASRTPSTWHRRLSSKPDKGKADDEYVITQWGSRAFRILNFELYTSATPLMRTLAYVGSTAFVGILGYWTLADSGYSSALPGTGSSAGAAPTAGHPPSRDAN